MAKESIADFLLSVGFDMKPVEAGLNKLTKLITDYEKVVGGVSKKLNGKSSALMGPPKALYEKAINNRIAAEEKARIKQQRDAERDAKKHYETLRKLKEQEAAKSEKAEALRQKAIARQAQVVSAARIRQAVSGLTARSGNKINASNSMFQRSSADILQEKLGHKTEAYLNTTRVRRGINSGLIDENSIRSQLSAAKSASEYRIIQTKLTSDLALKQAAVNAKLKEQNYLLQRGVTSTKQMLGNYVSAFAVVGGLSNVTKIGQDFESVQSTFQSVSDSSKDAADNLQFVRDQVSRLGIDYRENAKGFAQMLAANQGQLQKSDLKELFLGVAEASTVLGLSMDDQTGTIKALSQMLGKTKVMAEELRSQLGDRLPSAVPLMAKAAQDAGLTINGTVAELNDLMQKGKVYSDKILPYFAKRLREFANANGALEAKLKSNRVAMGRMISTYQIAAADFFQSGYGEGLTETFNALADTIDDLGPMFRVLSKIIGAMFKAFAFGLKLVSAPLNFFFTQIEKVTDIFGDWIITIPAGLGLIYLALTRITKAAALFGIAINAGFLPILLTLTAVVGALMVIEDFFRSFDSKYDTVLKRVGNTLSDFKYRGFSWGNEAMVPPPSSGPTYQPAPTVNVGTQNININGAQDPKAVAREVAAYQAMTQR